MRKFTKILTLILTLAVIVATFSVVAIAAAPTTPATLNPATGSVGDGTYTGIAAGKSLSNASDRLGKFTAAQADDGNIYVLNEYESATGTKNDYYLFNPTYQRDAYSVTNYKYYVFDYDIMTLTGSYGEVTVQADIWNGKSSMFYGQNKDITSYFSTTPYEWQHVTHVVEYAAEGVFKQHYYVNGVRVAGSTHDYSKDTTWTNLNGNYSEIIVGAVRFMSVKNADAVVGYDNLKSSFFPENYTLEQISTYFYTENYVFPYGRTEAKIGDTIYDDVNKAIAAAGENDVVKLTMNAARDLVIDKNVTIDANIYDADGTATGELYTYEFKSTQAYIPTATDTAGILSYAPNPNRVFVSWDPACDTECDCYADFGGHKLTASTLAVLGEAPFYPAEAPVFETVNGLKKEFLGWSYENDGTVDEIKEITEADVALGTLNLYPVYKQTQYDIEYITSAGVSTYHFEDEFYTVISKAAAGSTVRLHSDIYTECATITLTVSITLDLNGHDLKRTFVYGNVYEATVDAETGDYICDTTGTPTAVAVSYNFFTSSTKYISLRITSTAGGGSIYSASMEANTWKYNGEIVKREATGTVKSNRLFTAGTSSLTLKLDGGITVYMYTIWHQVSASATDLVVDIKDIIFYRVDNGIIDKSNGYYSVIAMLSAKDNTINLENSKFIFPVKSTTSSNFIDFISLGTSKKYYEGCVSNVTVKNCDIVKPDGVSYINIVNNRTEGTANFVYENCRLYDITANIAVSKNGTIFSSGKDASGETLSSHTVADGYEKAAVSLTGTYAFLDSAKFAVNASGDGLSFDFAKTNKSLTFSAAAVKPVTVNWIIDGEVIKTETLTPAVDTLVAPAKTAEILEDDPYRNKGYVWVDAIEGGNIISDILGLANGSFAWAEEYNFYGVKEHDGVINYVGGIKDVMFNVSYYTNFKYNLYLPADEKITIDGIELELVGTVAIYGNKYNAYVGDWNTTGASDNTAVDVTFTVDGVTYTQTFNFSALVYAEMILSNPVNDVEAKAVANMVRYIKEARLASSLEAGEEFDKLIALGNLADLGAKEDYVDTTVDYSTLAGYVSEIRFMLDGTNAAYLITLTSSDVDVAVKFVDGEEIVLADSTTTENAKYTTGTRVYDIANKAIEITVTIPAADGGEPTVITGTYSVKAYINATDNALTKAMYEFGVAADAYRSFLMEDN